MSERLRWFLAQPVFLIAYRLLLHLYWLPDRQPHVALGKSAAFGDGMLDGLAISVWAYHLGALLLLWPLLPRLRTGTVLASLAAVAVGTFALQWAVGAVVEAPGVWWRFTRHGPTVICTVTAVLVCRSTAQRNLRASTPRSS